VQVGRQPLTVNPVGRRWWDAGICPTEQEVRAVPQIGPEQPQTHITRVGSLLPADSPRLVGEDAEHIRVLAESGDRLPPILVHRNSMRVIDGMHRLRAAVLRGQDEIEVRFFEGDPEDAFVEAVRANVTHGLPLSFADREAAVARIMSTHPQWSDRAISAATGLAPQTVRSVRTRTGAAAQVTARVGRDGRVRPLDGAEGRLAAERILAERPDASLREVALAAGISPATALDVRQRLGRGDDPVPARLRPEAGRTGSGQAGSGQAGSGQAGSGQAGSGQAGSGQAGSAGGPPRHGGARDGAKSTATTQRAAVLQSLRGDPSVRFAAAGRSMLRWLFAHTIRTQEWRDFAAAVPEHSAPVVAALARGCADDWLTLADELERRMQRPDRPGTPAKATDGWRWRPQTDPHLREAQT
jgi:ParB-like chromosome segregation protein Spo0J